MSIVETIFSGAVTLTSILLVVIIFSLERYLKHKVDCFKKPYFNIIILMLCVLITSGTTALLSFLTLAGILEKSIILYIVPLLIALFF